MRQDLPSLMKELAQSQWLSREDIAALQLARLRTLLGHFFQQSPVTRARIEHAGTSVDGLSASMAAFARLPLMSRRELQIAKDDFAAVPVTASHRPVYVSKSSGSTGEPVSVRRTAVSQRFWQATTMREHLWHARDARGTLAAVRANLKQPSVAKTWGAPVAQFFETGPAYGIPSNTDVRVLLELLTKTQPHYLLVYPSIWRALLDAMQFEGFPLTQLRQVRTIGETVSETLRTRSRQQCGLELVDLYSAEEVGTVAIQCPHSGLYHVMAEGLIVEVLRPDGTPCKLGETGRVVVTDLLNLATPLIRYDNGDYAELGPPCTCGRGLPTLKRILGRKRNMVKLPDGRSYWPTTGFREFNRVADVRQYQFVQKSLQEMEVRLVVAGGKLSADQESAMTEVITRWIGHAFNYRFVYFEDHIPRHRSGKFEEFMCTV